jgi:hypothetical protein
MKTPNEHPSNIPKPPYPGNVNVRDMPHYDAEAEDRIADEAIEEKNDKPAGNTLKWTIAVAVIVLLIIYFLFFYEGDNSVMGIRSSN